MVIDSAQHYLAMGKPMVVKYAKKAGCDFNFDDLDLYNLNDCNKCAAEVVKQLKVVGKLR